MSAVLFAAFDCLRGLLNQRSVKRIAASVMEDMRRLHSMLSLTDGRRKPQRTVEVPSKTQSEVLLAPEHQVDRKGILGPTAHSNQSDLLGFYDQRRAYL